jgi:hypothetical protein
MTELLEKLKTLADPQYYLREEVNEDAMYHWWYNWYYKNDEGYFSEFWNIKYDEILKQMVYFCGESVFEYAYHYFYNIFKDQIVDCFIYDYTIKSSKTIKEYFLNNKQEIFSPVFEKYPKSWKTVFRDLPPTTDYVNRIFYHALNDHIKNRITDMYNKKQIQFILRTRKCIISGDLFTDSIGTVFNVRKPLLEPVLKLEWELQEYKPQISPGLFDKFCRLGSDIQVKESIPYLRKLLDLFEYIPPKNCTTYSLFCNIPKQKYIEFIKMQPNVYYFCRYSDVYGSWLRTIKETGYLGENDYIRNSFGYRVVAKDGHICNSLAEKNIDDWLYIHKIDHIKEPPYPNNVRKLMKSNVRADWLIGNTYVEYFGLQTEENYQKKTSAKIVACNVLGIDLKVLYPGDEYHLDVIFKEYM